jgi:hypothetical protein
MAKYLNDTMLDAALNTIKNNATCMDVCSTLGATPTYANVTAASLANTITAKDDFTLADGDTSGRNVTVASKSGISVTASGTAAEVVLTNASSTVHFSTTLSATQALTSGKPLSIGSHTLTLQAAT